MNHDLPHAVAFRCVLHEPSAARCLIYTDFESADEQRAATGSRTDAPMRWQKGQDLHTRARPPFPLHLLRTTSPSISQMRYSSTNSPHRSSESGPQTQDPSVKTAQPEQAPPSFFGFQSLAGLFAPAEPRRRYSRPELERVDVSSPKPSPSRSSVSKSRSDESPTDQTLPSEAASSDTHDSDISKDGSAPYRRIVTPLSSVRPAEIAKKPHRNGRPRFVATDWVPADPDSETASKTGERIWPSQKTLRRSKDPLHFQRRTAPLVKTQEPRDAWGVKSIQSSEAESFGTQANPSEAEASHPHSRGSTRTQAVKTSGKRVQTKNASEASSQLTHVKSSGEAHMVDVGAKPATRRVALATAAVTFSNPEVAELIASNTNQKGDVLGVARVAGIMAAKKTADIIPLCHPLHISKVDVDLTLVPSERTNGFATVRILTQVECTGPTGVEMEALTATGAAAMTVFDMCKAVDRGIVIQGMKVVYKSGGKSGTHVNKQFAKHRARKFWSERGLEVPTGNDGDVS